METELIKGLFTLLSNNIYGIIYFFVLVEIYLVAAIFYMMRKHERILSDVVDNLVKGFPDAPDKDSNQHIHEKIQTALQFITSKIDLDSQMRQRFAKNVEKINERPFYTRHYRIESHASIMSTLVQVFPLLGILGTILAIAQATFQTGGQIDATSISSAFVLAMDTTILGISFSILFMIVESGFQSKIERVVNESKEFRRILSEIYLSRENDK